jgi:hypothetical protein
MEYEQSMIVGLPLERAVMYHFIIISFCSQLPLSYDCVIM